VAAHVPDFLARSTLAAITLTLVLLRPLGAVAAPGPEPPARTWALTLNRATLYSGPNEEADSFGAIPALTTLQILGYQGDWAHVLEPRTRTEAWLPGDQLGPGEPPSRYVLLPRPALVDEFHALGVVTEGVPLAVYPTPAEEAVSAQLNPTTWLTLTGAVAGEDGSRWYRTDTDEFVPADAVFMPERTADFTGRWLDVNLVSPARVTAYEGDADVSSFLAIKGTGTWPTPSGVFTILRRVANETMSSDTIGIPRLSPGGYHLTNVLFTQYFSGDGASFHYNYWSSAWGYPGSHGCLGLTYGDSAWLWEWARVGTPVVIHY
jgi:hypothetical protein